MVSIIGAGIAGLATAIALQQQNIKVQIFERTAVSRNIGAGVVLWPNAMFVLKQLGLLEKVLANSFLLSTMQRYNQHNQPLGTLSIERINAQTGLPSRSILRSRLLALLLEHVQALGISLHYDHSLASIREHEHEFTLSFKGQPPRTTQAVIGADGRMSSVIRQYLHGDNQAVYQKFVNVLGIANFATHTAAPAVLDYWGIGERFGIVPVSQERAYWAAGWYCAEKADLDKNDTGQLQRLLTSKFSHWPTPVQHLLSGIEPNSVKALHIHDHNPCQNWSKGKVLMIGDAAHAALPTSGQGACQALEDAWWLARIVHQQGLNAAAFTRFSQQRLAKTASVTHAGRALARSIFNPDAEACQQRNEQSKNSDFEQSAIAMANFWMEDLG